ncbi:MAG: hypothetical protein ABIH23_25595 [bacterium]
MAEQHPELPPGKVLSDRLTQEENAAFMEVAWQKIHEKACCEFSAAETPREKDGPCIDIINAMKESAAWRAWGEKGEGK